MPLHLRHALFGACLALAAACTQAGEIAVIVKTTNSTFWQNVNKGAEAGMKDVPGHTMTFSGPASESAIADQVNLVENAVNRRVAGIVLAPSDPDALVPAIKKAWEARIPVVLIDSRVSDAGARYYQSFLTTDNRAAGELCAKELIARVGTTGKVAVMSYVAGAGSEIGRVGAFTAYLKANSKLEIVGPFYSQSQMATALNQTTDVLAAHRDLKGIFGANEPTAVAWAAPSSRVAAPARWSPSASTATRTCRSSSTTARWPASPCKALSRWANWASRRSRSCCRRSPCPRIATPASSGSPRAT